VFDVGSDGLYGKGLHFKCVHTDGRCLPSVRVVRSVVRQMVPTVRLFAGFQQPIALRRSENPFARRCRTL
jgi:hypothetical protein